MRARQPRQPDPLCVIPGVGPSIAQDLRDLGIDAVADLRGRDPEQMYQALIRLRGVHQDRCLLYVIRCAVYVASTPVPEPQKCLWWNWKDTASTALPRRRAAARRR